MKKFLHTLHAIGAGVLAIGALAIPFVPQEVKAHAAFSIVSMSIYSVLPYLVSALTKSSAQTVTK